MLNQTSQMLVVKRSTSLALRLRTAFLLAPAVAAWCYFAPGPVAEAAEQERQVAGIGIVLMQVPMGTFQMGSRRSEEGRKPDEGPLTTVSFTYSFWMGKYEITQEQYRTLADEYSNLDEDPSFFRGERMMKEGLRDFGNEPRRPVENVTWEQATNFCAMLTKRERARIPQDYEFRLPTEAEWEYACRSGTTNSFSFGDGGKSLGEYAWFKGNSGGQPQPVGKKKPTSWGLYDMHGNIMEWCLDWYGPNLPGGSVTNWMGPPAGTERVLRGGGWANDNPANFRCADRWRQPPATKGNGYGFRIVLAPTVESLRKKQ